MLRDYRDAVLPGNPSKAERKAAAKRAIGISGMTFLFAGAMGQFGAWALTGVINALFGGDEDDPWDAETAARVGLTQAYGPEVSAFIMDGPMSAITQMNVASRVSLNNLFFREMPAGVEGRDYANRVLINALGPMAAMLSEGFEGVQEISEGRYQKGAERLMPKALKDMSKAIRYMEEGVTNRRGDVIVTPEDISNWNAFSQAFGFSPTNVTLQYEQNRATGNVAKAITDRRASLLDRLAVSIREADIETRKEVIEEIKVFNNKNPSMRIESANALSSLRSRYKYSARAKHGLSLPPKLNYLHEKLNFTEGEDK